MMRTAKNLGRHELIGLNVIVQKGDKPEGEGIVMDESMNTFEISDGSKNRIIPKTGRKFIFHLDGQKVELEGDKIRFKPEDRTKKVR
jgi:ribonuclease P protein subunit POP4